MKNQSENKKSSNFFDARRNITALRKNYESRKSNDKKDKKQASYFTISRSFQLCKLVATYFISQCFCNSSIRLQKIII